MIWKPSVLLLISLMAVVFFARSPAGGTNEQTVGLLVNEPAAFDGYTLFAPIDFEAAYLIDNDGLLVHSWTTSRTRGAPYLLEDGNLIHMILDGVEELTWDGAPVWEFDYRDEEHRPHHDLEVLPNGNVLIIAWEFKTAAEAILAGRDPSRISQGELWPDSVIEVEPVGTSGGSIVWEWRLWDHLIQDYDPARANYGVVADHPELIDINFGRSTADVYHTNAVDYNEELDQIVVSVRNFSEIWVIDHSTKTAESAGHSGGNSGKGGDLLYRWGNPQAYRAGGPDDQQFFSQHDSRWIEPGLPGEGNILVFNNGVGRPGEDFSSIDEIAPPVDLDGNYALTPAEAYGPAEPIWTYVAAEPSDFFAAIISGATRLPNGNTLIDDGTRGTLFEVTPDGETVWKYVNPVTASGPLVQGNSPPDGSNHVFRALRYAPGYAGLQGRDLTPGDPIELPGALPKPSPAFTRTAAVTLPTTPTATSTATPTPAPATPTPSPATPKPTATPQPDGDVNGDGMTTSVDALLILQFIAGLLLLLPNAENADVSLNGEITNVDSALILQFIGGLIDSLPTSGAPGILGGAPRAFP